jgi:hypothetical protein
MMNDPESGRIQPNARSGPIGRFAPGGLGEREPTRSDLDALARRIVAAHDRHMIELENELSDRLFDMLERYRTCRGECYHPAILDRRGDLSL